MQFKTIDSSKITWTIYPADSWEDFTESYCADGDGLVTIKAKKCGCFVLSDELEFLKAFDTLAEALEGGQLWLANDYNEVYQEVLHHNGEAV
jgi:hypothetical protein